MLPKCTDDNFILPTARIEPSNEVVTIDTGSIQGGENHASYFFRFSCSFILCLIIKRCLFCIPIQNVVESKVIKPKLMEV